MSAMGVFQTLSALQVAVAPVAEPFSSTRLIAGALFAPAASFQFARATTPAVSELAIEVVPRPTKSMLIAGAELGVPTTSVVVAVCVKEPLMPVIVSVELPAGVLPVVV